MSNPTKAEIDRLTQMKKRGRFKAEPLGADRVRIIPDGGRFGVSIKGSRVAFDSYEDWRALQTLKGHPDWLASNWQQTREKQIRVWTFVGLQPGERLLEVGFRDGFNLRHLGEIGVHAVGIDVNPFAIENAAALGVEAYGDDIQKRTRFADASFDVVSACDVLEHCFDPDGALDEIRRVLKPEGRAVIEIPFETEFSDNLTHGHAALFHDDARATALFERHGFDVAKRDLTVSTRNLYALMNRPVHSQA